LRQDVAPPCGARGGVPPEVGAGLLAAVGGLPGEPDEVVQ